MSEVDPSRRRQTAGARMFELTTIDEGRFWLGNLDSRSNQNAAQHIDLVQQCCLSRLSCGP